MNKIFKPIYSVIIASFLLGGCNDYLDVVPDNLAEIDGIFNMRNTAERYWATCYSYMPNHGSLSNDPGFLAGDEIWARDYTSGRGAMIGPFFNHQFLDIAYNRQNTFSPIGGGDWKSMYEAIRHCNVFLENVNRVPDISENERERWIGEVTFLKAYYHYNLIKRYGPIHIIRENLTIDADEEQVRIMRDPVDECFDYVLELLDEAIPLLPIGIFNPEDELGRVTAIVAKTVKAEVAVFKASPLFNGNSEMAALVNPDGTQLFPQNNRPELWEAAALACKEAIMACEEEGMTLYEYNNDTGKNLSTTTLLELTNRQKISDKWNSELIWGASKTFGENRLLQGSAQPMLGSFGPNFDIRAELSPTLQIAELYYSKNGLPISKDNTYDYNNRYQLKVANTDNSNPLQLGDGNETAGVHFDREPRYYASLGFHNGHWFGNGKLEEDNLHLMSTLYQSVTGWTAGGSGSTTGFYIKKLIHFESTEYSSGSRGRFTTVEYPFPIFRLADLYLLYAEALNESGASTAEVVTYIDMVRERAGIPTVEDAWTNFSNEPTKFQTQNGLREIIQQERSIELMFEGKRFWDIRRWKLAPEIMNQDILGFNYLMKDVEDFHRPIVLHQQTFGLKDYFWPFSTSQIENNTNLVQNLGW
jgi:hypothetical protein